MGQAGKAFALAGDVCDEAFAKALVDAAIGEYGGLDVGFNNAGTLGAPGMLTDIEVGEWEKTLRTNLTSAMFGAKYQMPEIAKRGGGSVIFTSTFVGHTIGLPGHDGLCASKMGLIGMSQCLAVEYGAANVRVNALLPGGTDTPMAGSYANDRKHGQWWKSSTPLAGLPIRLKSPKRPCSWRLITQALLPARLCLLMAEIRSARRPDLKSGLWKNQTRPDCSRGGFGARVRI